MAVFRVERTRDYTVMSNFHLRDQNLSLKSKGLLSQMLSLPEDWDYSLAGLSHINRESKDAIRSAVRELEQAGYIRRHQTTDANGRFSGNEYVIYEKPMLPSPLSENPTTEITTSGNTSSEKPTQLSIDRTSKEKQSTDIQNIDSIPFPSAHTAAALPEPMGNEKILREMALYREIIKENIEYGVLLKEYPYDHDRLEEILELLVETVCTKRQTVRVSGNDFPAEVVRSRLLKLDAEHIRFVFDCLNKNTTKIRNIRQYLLATLYNAPATIGNYYAALVNHDMYGGSR